MQVHYRDAVALSARTLGALFSFSPDSAQAAPLVAALRDGSWQAQWPFPLAESLVAGFAAASDEALPQAWQACLSVPGRCPPRRGVRCGWIKRMCCSATPLWHCGSGCERTGLLTRRKARSRKTILARSCCSPPGCASPGRRRRFRSCSPGTCSPGPAGSSRCLSPGPDTPFINPSQSWRRRRSPSGSASFRLPSPTSRCIAKRIAMPGNGHGIFSDNVTQPVFISALSSLAVSPLRHL